MHFCVFVFSQMNWSKLCTNNPFVIWARRFWRRRITIAMLLVVHGFGGFANINGLDGHRKNFSYVTFQIHKFRLPGRCWHAVFPCCLRERVGFVRTLISDSVTFITTAVENNLCATENWRHYASFCRPLYIWVRYGTGNRSSFYELITGGVFFLL